MKRTCSYCQSPAVWLMTQPAANGSPAVLVYSCGRHLSPMMTSLLRTAVDPPVTVVSYGYDTSPGGPAL